MSTPVAYRRLALPIAEPAAAAVIPFFDTMRRLELPGLIVPAVSPDRGTAISWIRQVLEPHSGRLRGSSSVFYARSPEKTPDIGLHIDRLPEDGPQVSMVVQHTEAGSADTMMARVAGTFANTLRWRKVTDTYPNQAYLLPHDTEQLLDQGLVDPDVLQPAVYTGSVAVGSLVIFAIGGPNPLAHRFISTAPGRRADSYQGTFKKYSGG